MLRHHYIHSIAVQQQVQAQDANTGAITITWTAVRTAPAEVLTGPGRETVAGAAKWSETDLRINCPWFPGLTSAMRVVWDGKPYDILSIETDATARREYRLRLKGGLTDGR
jgi:SPP1 family predicted phage head-tail adaptor